MEGFGQREATFPVPSHIPTVARAADRQGVLASQDWELLHCSSFYDPLSPLHGFLRVPTLSLQLYGSVPLAGGVTPAALGDHHSPFLSPLPSLAPLRPLLIPDALEAQSCACGNGLL